MLDSGKYGIIKVTDIREEEETGKDRQTRMSSIYIKESLHVCVYLCACACACVCVCLPYAFEK